MIRRRAWALLIGCYSVGAACQAAPRAVAGDGGVAPTTLVQAQQLPDRAHGTPPPVQPQPAYLVRSTELLENGDFARGLVAWSPTGTAATAIASNAAVGTTAMRVNSSTGQSFKPDVIDPGKSYRLTFVARALDQGFGTIWVRFREPLKHDSVRSFHQDVVDPSTRPYTITFDAPAFAALGEVQIETKRGALVVNSISLTMCSPTIQTERVVSWSNSFVPDGYALVFNDEFDGNELNRKKWYTRYIYGSETLDRFQGENEHYVDNQNHVVRDGVLHLTARRLAMSRANGVNYESGMIRSAWTAQYGFFEARVKMPPGVGVWPAFWLISDVSSTGRLGWPPEIDFFEFVNNGRDDRRNMIHLGLSALPSKPNSYLYVSGDFHVNNNDYYAPYDFSDGWHTIAGEWTPDSVTNYVDGVKVVARTYQWLYKDGEAAAPAHILLNLAIGGPWAGRYGIDDAAFPQSLDVDWIRAYQRIR
jgi:beta-glucanase (GH16 family)